MNSRLTHNWWAIALRGVVAILFGILAFLMPGLTLVALILLFGAYALVDGAFAVVAGLRRREGGPDWLLILGGIAGIAAGFIAFFMPGVTALVLLTIIAAWAIVTGIAEVVAAYRLREEIRGEWLLAINGILSVIFGIALVLFPGAGALTLVWLIAAYAIISGVMLVALALRLRSRANAGRGVPSGTASAS
jgi:uncharacterized membrane protein HdeD (DUF308 family)